MLISDKSESEIIKEIIFEFLDEKILDDASFIISEEGIAVINIDTFVDKTDAPKSMPYKSYGYKTVIMSASDVLAKGARPKYFLLSASIPRTLKIEEFREIIRGVSFACKKYGIKFIGGDLNEADNIVLSGVSLGFTDKIIKRDGLSVGDYLWTTGTFGKTGAALHFLLKEGKKLREKEMIEILNAFYYPPLRIECLELIKNFATSSIDSSDGLAKSLQLLAEASGVKIVIENIPIDKLAVNYASINNIKARDLALYGGEEFEIVFSTKEKIKDVRNCKVYYLGRAEHGEGVYYGGKKLERKGFEHFKEKA